MPVALPTSGHPARPSRPGRPLPLSLLPSGCGGIMTPPSLLSPPPGLPSLPPGSPYLYRLSSADLSLPLTAAATPGSPGLPPTTALMSYPMFVFRFLVEVFGLVGFLSILGDWTG